MQTAQADFNFFFTFFTQRFRFFLLRMRLHFANGFLALVRGVLVADPKIGSCDSPKVVSRLATSEAIRGPRAVDWAIRA